MFVHRPWTTALVGAVVVWVLSVSGLGPATPPAESRVVPIPTGVGTPPTPTSIAAPELADILMSGRRYDRLGQAMPDYEDGSLRRSSPPGAGSSLGYRLSTNAARLETVQRTLPPTFILVNIPQARLWMVRDGKVRGSMRVIVGRPDQPTPEMTTELTHVILNPRWNVPQDIVRSSLAPKAVSTRGRSLTDAGFEVMSSWQDDADVIPAGEIDWPAVAAGRIEAPVRQKPGAGNAMGSAKFVVTNDDGIYLHDTPDRAAFQKARRTLSAGCIRIEDYRRLVDFLVPQPLPPGRDADRPTYVRLGTPMPIFLTYITAIATDGGTMQFPDPYELDS